MNKPKQPENHDIVDESAEESFPTSDPPSFTPETSVGPLKDDKAERSNDEHDEQDQKENARFRESIAGEEDPGAAAEALVQRDSRTPR